MRITLFGKNRQKCKEYAFCLYMLGICIFYPGAFPLMTKGTSFHAPILVNDSHDGNLKNCSIACENRIYGNLSLFALEKQLTVSQMQTVQAEIRRFENTVKASIAYDPGHGEEQNLSWSDAETARQACLSGHAKDQSMSLIDELNAMDLDMEGNKNPEFQREVGNGLDR